MQFFINSLKRRPERAYSRLGALEAQGFPMEDVHIVWGEYWDDYPDFDALCNAAISDFPEMEGIRTARRIGYVAAMWSFFRTYRAIQENGIQEAVVFEDDFLFRPGKEYDYFKEIHAHLPKDYQIGILGYGTKNKKGHKMRELEPINRYWGHGVVNLTSSHNIANIYTPDGLQMIRDAAGAAERLSTIERLIGNFHETLGVYSLLRPICWVTKMQGISDATPGDGGVENSQSISDVERWTQGYDVGHRLNHKYTGKTD